MPCWMILAPRLYVNADVAVEVGFSGFPQRVCVSVLNVQLETALKPGHKC